MCKKKLNFFPQAYMVSKICREGGSPSHFLNFFLPKFDKITNMKCQKKSGQSDKWFKIAGRLNGGGKIGSI